LYALLQPEPAAEPVGESKEEEKPAAVTAPTTDATTASATTATATTAAATDAEAGEVVTGKSGLSETVSAAVVQEVNAVAEKVRLLNGCSTAPDTRVCLRSSSSESIAVFSKQLLFARGLLRSIATSQCSTAHIFFMVLAQFTAPHYATNTPLLNTLSLLLYYDTH
jgi:hypothetical protein